MIGDYANGKDSGTIEVVLIGEDLNAIYIDNLAVKIENKIKRKIKFYINEYQYGKELIIYEAT